MPQLDEPTLCLIIEAARTRIATLNCRIRMSHKLHPNRVRWQDEKKVCIKKIAAAERQLESIRNAK